MPWTVADVDRHNSGLSAKQKRQWVAVANSHLASCIRRGGSDATCAPEAIRMANGVVSNNELGINVTIAEGYEVKEVTRGGVKFLVVPIVMMTEGVRSGSKGPLLHTVDEYGRFPGSWDGRPIVISHPEVDGQPVSANSPDIEENKTVGKIYNTDVVDNNLITEGWFNEEKLRNIAPEVLDAILNRRVLEVSIGVFTDQDMTAGTFNNENYAGIARNHRPDHLAILPGGTGACSVEDGCGVRQISNNQKEGGNMDENAVVTGMEAKRKQLGMSVDEFYAVVRNPPSESKLPIFDAAHVRNALARFSQTQGLSDAEKTTAKRKIAAAARKFHIDASSLSANMFNDSFDILRSAKEMEMFEFKSHIDTNDQGYVDLVNAARQKMDAMDTNDSIHFLEELFSDYVIYRVHLRIGGDTIYKQNYQFTDGVFNLTGNPVAVQKKVEYAPISNNETIIIRNKKGGFMANVSKCAPCVLKKVNELIANEATSFTEEDREWLEGLEEAKLDKLAPVINNDDEDDDDEPVVQRNSKSKKGKGSKESDPGKKDEPVVLSAEKMAALEYGIKKMKEERDTLIAGIQANTSKELWPDALLNGYDLDMLQRLFNSVKQEEKKAETYAYQTAGGGSIPGFSANSKEFLAPTGVEVDWTK